jgi:hypothetical protein
MKDLGVGGTQSLIQRHTMIVATVCKYDISGVPIHMIDRRACAEQMLWYAHRTRHMRKRD